MTIALPTEQALMELGTFEERVRSRVIGNTPWYRWIKRITENRKVSDLADSLNIRISTGVPYLWNVFNIEGDKDRYGAMASVVGLVKEFPKNIAKLYSDVLNYINSFRQVNADEINKFIQEYALQVGSKIEEELPIPEVESSIEALEQLIQHAMVEDSDRKARLMRGLGIIKRNYVPGIPVEQLIPASFPESKRQELLRFAKSEYLDWRV